jgi:cell division protein FtsA
VKHTSVISVGGNHITNDIAAGLRTPISAAEEIKCGYGTALLSLVSGDETVEVPSTGGRSPRVLSKVVLSEIIEPRVTELFALVQRELVRAGSDELLTSGLVLTGGGANLKGIAQVAEQVFNLPVRVGVPSGVGGLSGLVATPEYATAVGLVLHGAHSLKQSRRQPGKLPVTRWVRKVGNWLSDHF